MAAGKIVPDMYHLNDQIHTQLICLLQINAIDGESKHVGERIQSTTVDQ
jgi:hypothetical protein